MDNKLYDKTKYKNTECFEEKSELKCIQEYLEEDSNKSYLVELESKPPKQQIRTFLIGYIIYGLIITTLVTILDTLLRSISIEFYFASMLIMPILLIVLLNKYSALVYKPLKITDYRRVMLPGILINIGLVIATVIIAMYTRKYIDTGVLSYINFSEISNYFSSSTMIFEFIDIPTGKIFRFVIYALIVSVGSVLYWRQTVIGIYNSSQQLIKPKIYLFRGYSTEKFFNNSFKLESLLESVEKCDNVKNDDEPINDEYFMLEVYDIDKADCYRLSVVKIKDDKASKFKYATIKTQQLNGNLCVLKSKTKKLLEKFNFEEIVHNPNIVKKPKITEKINVVSAIRCASVYLIFALVINLIMFVVRFTMDYYDFLTYALIYIFVISIITFMALKYILFKQMMSKKLEDNKLYIILIVFIYVVMYLESIYLKITYYNFIAVDNFKLPSISEAFNNREYHYDTSITTNLILYILWVGIELLFIVLLLLNLYRTNYQVKISREEDL